MDNTRGEFIPVDEEKFSEQLTKEKPRVFKTGEVLEIRGSKMRVHKIHRNKITFKLLK